MSQENREKERELESEIRSFEKERENIRKIIGKIGGQPTTEDNFRETEPVGCALSNEQDDNA